MDLLIFFIEKWKIGISTYRFINNTMIGFSHLPMLESVISYVQFSALDKITENIFNINILKIPPRHLSP